VQDYTHQPEKHAGLLLTGTLCAFALGRFSAPLLMKYIPRAAMMIYAMVNALSHVVRCAQARMGRNVGGLPNEFLHVDHVPTILPGAGGAGPLVKLGGSLL